MLTAGCAPLMHLCKLGKIGFCFTTAQRATDGGRTGPHRFFWYWSWWWCIGGVFVLRGGKVQHPRRDAIFLSWAEAGYSWWFSGNFGWFPLNFGWTWSHYARIYNQEIAVKYSYIWWSHTEFSQIFMYFRWIRLFFHARLVGKVTTPWEHLARSSPRTRVSHTVVH